MKPKPILVQDSREQRPLSFNPDKVDVVVRCLPAGDYSIEGYTDKIAVERKSVEDLVGTVIRARGRFDVELGKLAKYDRAWIVVEDDISAIYNHHFRSMVHPSCVLGALVAIDLQYKIPTVFAGNREQAADQIQRLLLRYAEHAEFRQKEETRREAWSNAVNWSCE